MKTAYEMANCANVSHKRVRGELMKELPCIPWPKAYNRRKISEGSKLHRRVVRVLLQVKAGSTRP